MAHSSGREGTRSGSEKDAWDLSEPMRRMRLKGTSSEGRSSAVWTTNQDACVPAATDFSPRVQNRERAMAAFASVPAPESEPFSPSYHPATSPQPIWTGGGLWAPPRSKEPAPTSSSAPSTATSRTGTSKKEGRASSNQREKGHRQGQERGRRGAVDARLRAEPIWLSARLNELVLGLLPTQEETERKARTIFFLQRIVVGTWPLAKIDIFGSAANSFGVRGSDIDVSVDLPIEEDDRSAKVEVIERLGEILQQVGMEKVIILAHARVPLVKYVDPRTGCASDICINNRVAVANTKLLCDYARIDIRLRQLAFVVKHWAKARQVNETYRGTLSSYAYVLMCIHLLQRKNPPILPCLQGMRPTFSKLLQKGDDLVKCEYFDQVDALKGFGEPNKETLADLLFSFFEYWAWRHDYAHNVVSVRTGGFLTKAEKGWTKRIGNERHLICIEDPFETGHDLGRVVDRNSISALRDEFVRAAKILRDEEDPLPRLFEPYVRPDEHEISEG